MKSWAGYILIFILLGSFATEAQPNADRYEEVVEYFLPSRKAIAQCGRSRYEFAQTVRIHDMGILKTLKEGGKNLNTIIYAVQPLDLDGDAWYLPKAKKFTRKLYEVQLRVG